MSDIVFVIALMVALVACIITYVLAARHGDEKKARKMSREEFARWWYKEFHEHYEIQRILEEFEE